jgi:hypothetical protein
MWPKPSDTSASVVASVSEAFFYFFENYVNLQCYFQSERIIEVYCRMNRCLSKISKLSGNFSCFKVTPNMITSICVGICRLHTVSNKIMIVLLILGVV